MKDKILLFIPCYNCEKQIIRVLDKLQSKTLSYVSEILIVNNQSNDLTEEMAKKSMNRIVEIPVKLIRNTRNYNLGGSHKIAFNYAINNKFDYIIVLHGDDQGDINDIIEILEKRRYKMFDSLLGARFLKKSKLINYSKIRICGNYVFNFLLSFVTRHKISDLGSGLNLYKVNYLESRFYMTFPNTLTFNVYMLLYGIYQKSKFDFFPLTWREEDQISNAKFIKQSKEILFLTIKYILCPRKIFDINIKQYADEEYTFKLVSENKLN